MQAEVDCSGARNRWGASRAGREAFTLTELIVVLASVAILAGVLGQAFAGASRKSGIIECKNNLRQVGTAIDSYTKDHQDTLPGPLWLAMFPTYAGAGAGAAINSDRPTTYSLAYHLAPYFGLPAADTNLREAPALKCPVSLEARPNLLESPNPLFQWIAYVGCLYVTNTPGARLPGYSNDDIILYPFGRPNSPTVTEIKLGKIKRPSEQWAMTDADRSNVVSGATYYSPLPNGPVHNQRPGGSRGGAVRNYLYFDGSVRPVQTVR